MSKDKKEVDVNFLMLRDSIDQLRLTLDKLIKVIEKKFDDKKKP